MTVTGDEINILVRRYLQEIGYFHTSYVFAHESLVDRCGVPIPQLPPHALVTILKKGMLYMQMEKGISHRVKTDASSESIVTSLLDLVRRDEPLVPVKQHRPKPVPPPPVIPTPKLPIRQVTPMILKPITPFRYDPSEALILRGHFSDVYCGAWTPDAHYLATGSGDATAIIWELRNHEYLNHFILDHATQQERIGKDIATLAWNPSGTILATGCNDGSVRLWTIRGELKYVLSFHSGCVFVVQFSPDGSLLLTGGSDHRVILWNVATGDKRQVFQDHRGCVLDVDWMDCRTFASCSGDTRILICSVGSAGPVQVLDGHKGEVNQIEWDPSKKMLASCSDDRTVRIWKPYERGLPLILAGHSHHVYTIKWQPGDRKILASGAFDYTVRLWDASNGACLHVLTRHSQAIYAIAFSPRGQFFVSGGIDNVMNMWRTQDAALVASFDAGAGIFEAHWSPAGDCIALTLANCTVIVLDATNTAYVE
jgi:transducin (beta)-like 1